MKIIVGLGNPGPRYETTRHNVGFLAIDRMVDEWAAVGPTHKSQGEIYEGSVEGEKILLVKPQTYMNLSGRCVAPLFQFYKCRPEDLIVIHDEIDLKPMSIRIKAGGGSAGHNGIRSLDQELGGANTGYYRIRIGVGRSENPNVRPADYVLAPFTDDELIDLDPLLDQVKEAVKMLLRGDMVGAQNKFHRS